VSAGRILEILLPTGSSSTTNGATVAIKPYDISDTNDKHYNMPILTPSITEKDIRCVCVVPEDVLFIFNAQHDCRACGCAPTGTQNVRQERQETRRTRGVIEHADGPDADRYVLNLHALHNAGLIRQTLPRHLTAPAYYIPVADRVDKHKEIAVRLQVSGPQKRANTQAKAAETRVRNKIAKQAQAARGGRNTADVQAGSTVDVGDGEAVCGMDSDSEQINVNGATTT